MTTTLRIFLLSMISAGALAGECGPAITSDGSALPPMDSLTADSDYSAFMAPGVDADIRRQALRRLFASPKFNVVDPMTEYMRDYHSFAPLGDIETADMKHRAVRNLQAARVD